MKIEIKNRKPEVRTIDKARLTSSDHGCRYSPFVIRHSSLEQGMITVLYIALLAIMMVLVMVETSSVIRLRREVKLMEQQQIKRLNSTPAAATQTTTNP